MLLAGANAVAVIALAIICLLRGELSASWRLPAREHLRALGLGLLNPLIYYLVLLAAYDRLPGQVAQPLNYTWAITFSLLAIPLLGQRLVRGELSAMLIAWVGVLLIATDGAAADPSLATRLRRSRANKRETQQTFGALFFSHRRSV